MLSKEKIKVAIITNVIANYRADFYRRIIDDESVDITIFCQPSIKGMNLKTVHDQFSKNVQIVKSCGLAKEKIAWQFLPLCRLYNSFDVLIFYGNPRVLSNVVYSVLFKLLGKKIIIWGQAHTAGASPGLEKIRLAWWRLFDYLFLYTDKEIDYLKTKGFKTKRILGMNNGLDQEEIERVKLQWSLPRLDEWRRQQGLEFKTLILSCARLDSKNQFELMVPVLKELCKTHKEILWCVIGQGEREQFLKETISREKLDKYVLWLGSIYDENQLAPWFLSSRVLIHPGAIGLSLLHAFGYGLPVITHGDIENQMPEIAAFENEINGLAFESGSHVSMLSIIENNLFNESKLAALSSNAYITAKTKYNTKVMANRFIEISKNT